MQVFSQRWSQTRPRIAGSGLSRRVIRTASARSPGAHGGHVAGHLLVDRALVEAGRRDAVEGAERARGLGAVRPERVLRGSASRGGPVGVRAQVEPRAVGDERRRRRRRAVEPARASAVRRMKSAVSRRADRVERGVDVLRVLEQPQVAARLEQVRADRDGAHAAGQQVGHVEAVGAAGERERQLAARTPRRCVAARFDGDRVERPARQVHRRVAVEDAAPVLHLERVRQLQAEGEAARRGGRAAGCGTSGRRRPSVRSWPKASSGIGTSREARGRR